MNGSTSEFSSYTRDCQQQMRKKLHPSFPHSSLEKIFTYNSPFDWKPDHNSAKRVGVFMTHGLYGSPFSMRDLGKVLVAKGIHARAIQLPGHCTNINDITGIDLEEYQAVIKQHIELFKEDVDELYLLGFSFGGLLSIDYATHNPCEKLCGLVIINPALGLASPYAGLLPALDKLLHLKWYSKGKEHDFTRYQAGSVHAAHQVYRLSQIIKHQDAPKLNRLLLTCAVNDEDVSAQTILDYFNNIQTNEKQLLVYQPGDNSYCENITYRTCTYPEHQMIDFSHINVLFAPENPHYGINGLAYNPLYCLPFSKKKQTIHGAISRKNLKKYNVLRALYNPDFEFFSEYVAKFISSS